MNELPRRAQYIIDLRRQGKTLREIGDEVGITGERSRQILVEYCGHSFRGLITLNRRSRHCKDCGKIYRANVNQKRCPECKRKYYISYYAGHSGEMKANVKKYMNSKKGLRMQIRYLQKKLDNFPPNTEGQCKETH